MSNLLPQLSKFGSDESHNNLLKPYSLVHRGHIGIAVGWVNLAIYMFDGLTCNYENSGQLVVAGLEDEILRGRIS